MKQSVKRGLTLLLCIGLLCGTVFSTLCFAAETAGDANVDQNVNLKDVLVLRQYLAGLAQLTSVPHADVNGDGEVNMKDVLMLRRYLLGQETLSTFTTAKPEPQLTALEGTDRTLGVWWWRWSDGRKEETRETYLDFFEKNGVTEIYYYCGSVLNTEFNRTIVRDFVKAAMAHGMRVAYLFDVQEVVDADNQSFEKAVVNFNTYNSEHPEAPLYGIHCDIEPKWDRMQDYVDNFIVGDVSVARAAGVCVELDLNMNWDRVKFNYIGSATHNFDGEELPIYEILANNCDCMCMMSYRTSATRLVNGTEDSRAAAQKVGTKIVYGIEVGDSHEGANVDFHLHSKEYVYDFVAELDHQMQFELQPDAGWGYAIHHQSVWYQMRDFE